MPEEEDNLFCERCDETESPLHVCEGCRRVVCEHCGVFEGIDEEGDPIFYCLDCEGVPRKPKGNPIPPGPVMDRGAWAMMTVALSCVHSLSTLYEHAENVAPWTEEELYLLAQKIAERINGFQIRNAIDLLTRAANARAILLEESEVFQRIEADAERVAKGN